MNDACEHDYTGPDLVCMHCGDEMDDVTEEMVSAACGAFFERGWDKEPVTAMRRAIHAALREQP